MGFEPIPRFSRERILSLIENWPFSLVKRFFLLDDCQKTAKTTLYESE